MKSRKVTHMDLMIISWLAIKCVVDVVAFIYIIAKLTALLIIAWLAIKLVINTGALIYIVWRLRHHKHERV